MHTLLTSAPPSATANTGELALSLLGPSSAMTHLWSQIRRLAPHVRTVLLTGPPHAGQDAAAHLLHDLSTLPRRPFLHWNVAEAEDRLNRVSTLSTVPQEAFLYLPEIERLSPSAQAGLLRLLRTRRARGFTLAAATSEDVRAFVALGRFSGELAECLSAVRVAVPALSDRVEDLPMLLSQMLSLRSQSRPGIRPQLSEELLRSAMQYPWPGNLRELSEVADALLTGDPPCLELRAADLQRALALAQARRPSPAPLARMVKLDAVIQEHIQSVLRACHGNKLRAAETLGISRSTLYRMLDAAPQHNPLSLAG